MSIVQNVEKRKRDSDYFYSLFSLRQGHESFQYDFVLKWNRAFYSLYVNDFLKVFTCNKFKGPYGL